MKEGRKEATLRCLGKKKEGVKEAIKSRKKISRGKN